MSAILFEVVVILLLIALNGLFAMSELAVISARTSRLEQMAQEGNRGARTALELANSPNRFLSTVQVGITLVGIFAGAFGGATIARELAVLMADLPLVGPYAGAVSFALVVGSITFLSVVVGELVPKRLALHSTERIAAGVARLMNGLAALATPVVRLFSLATDAILRVLGIDAPPEMEVTEEEITMLVQQGARAGIIEEAERDMVESVFRLGDRRLEGMMTPRPEVVWLDVNADEASIRETLKESAHSRVPVCDGDLDHVLGVVRAKDLMAACLDSAPFDLREVMQEPWFAPESMLALTALERFKQTGVHLALLVDEYGGIEGVLTLIDILEAIVGDIPTVDELVEPPIVQREDGSWLVDGLMNIDEFKHHFDIRNLPGEDSYQTLGGFVVFMLGAVPLPGQHFGWGGFRFEVADMDGKRVDKVIVDQAPPDETEGEENGTGQRPAA
ncbi:MAG: hemolysin family protein [Candidatus Promineifilaceae bacterium]|nr:hemolysin family protein [Candidatus Promineifilaceae bacterium]